MKFAIDNNIVVSIYMEKNERTVVIPEGVKGINSEAFIWWYDQIDNLYIPTTLQVIEGTTFRSLRKIEVATGNSEFFSEDNCLIDIRQRKIIIGNIEGKIPKCAKIIGAYAYNGCEAEEIVIPGNIEVIEDFAFTYSKCRKVLIEEGVRIVGNGVFSDCHCLEEVLIPATVESIGHGPFGPVQNLKFIVAAGNRCIKNINGQLISNDALVYGCCNNSIPDCVKVIKACAFTRSNLKSLSIPSTVSRIEGHAFSLCSMLTDISIPESVKSIGIFSFAGCDSMTVTPEMNGIEVLDYEVFGGCKNLRKIHIGKNIREIKSTAFDGCHQIDEITVSDENNYYKSVENYLLTKDGKKLILASCNSKVPEGVESIEKYAFSRAFSSNLEKIVMPASLITVGSKAFSFSNSINQVIINEGLRKIGEEAFLASSLESITLPKGIITICPSAFRDCKRLKSVEFQSSELKVIAYSAFSGCCSLKSIVIPEGIESIDYFAFSSCKNLEKIVLPKTLNRICYKAFYGCTSLRQINVPKSVRIDADAFDSNSVVNRV